MKKVIITVLAVLLVLTSFIGCSGGGGETKSITAFCGAASKPAMEEAGQAFEAKTGIKVYFNFGGSGMMLSQMKLSQSGDLYIPGSPDFMEKAIRDGVVDSESIKIVAYLVPAILVQKGNPKNIESLSDLTRKDITMAIAEPVSVCVGQYAIELLDYNGLLSAVKQAGTCIVYAESCEKTATLIVLKAVDAVIGWTVFAAWNPETTDVIYLKPSEIPRLSYIPGAVSAFAQDIKSAQKFLDFLASSEGRDIFHRYGYEVTESEARKYAPEAKIGGEYQLPADFTSLVK